MPKKVALVHDDLVQWGGAERVLLGLSNIYPDAPIYTSVFNEDNPILREKFKGKKIITSFIQGVPNWKKLYKLLLPLYPIAFEQFVFDGFDLVISQTTRFAKCIITKPETMHICYCHTPPRFLYDYNPKKTGLLAIPRQTIKKPYFDFLKRYDQVIKSRVDKWVAGSRNAQDRLKQTYGIESAVIYPFVDMESFKEVDEYKGGYILVVSRLVDYKRVDLAVKAATSLGISLKVVGAGPQLNNLRKVAGNNVEFVELVPDEILYQLIAGCWCLVLAGEEDFGLTPLEAQAMGKPVVAFKKGGALESVVDGKTGLFFENQSVASLSESLIKLKDLNLSPDDCKSQANRFNFENFKKEWSTIF